MKNTRNDKIENTVEENYLGNKIMAWEYRWEEYSEKNDRWENKKEIVCHLFRVGSKNQPLSLGECNDGSKFTAVNQAINQAKEFVNICNKNGW